MDSPNALLDDPRGLAPAPTRRLYRDVLLPRTILPLAWIAAVGLAPAFLTGRTARRRNSKRSPTVVIESGRVGWTQVFFEELEGSAVDYFGKQAVHRAVIDRDKPYWPQFREWVDRLAPTHVVLDVRTPPQSWMGSLIEAFRVSWLVHRRGIYPIVIMTDAFYRRQRWHAAVLSAWQGTVVTFAARKIVRPLFPHSRVRGALIMPISQGRIEQLAAKRTADNARTGAQCEIAFVGNIYPPRSTFLEALAEELDMQGLKLTVHGDKGNRSNEEYWRVLADADIIVTTTMQGPDRNYIDWNWIRQAVHRYSETFAAGTAVVGAPVDGGFPPFVPGKDYLEFGSVRDAARAIRQLADDPGERSRIAGSGGQTYRQEIDSGSFWRIALGLDSYSP